MVFNWKQTFFICEQNFFRLWEFLYYQCFFLLFPWQLWAKYFLTLSISPFRSSHRKCSIKKAVVEVLNIHRKTRMLEFLFNKVQGWRTATLLYRDSNTVVFFWMFLFANSYRMTYVFSSKFLVKMITKEKM